MTSVFTKSIPDLQHFHAGHPVSAGKLNRSVDALNRIIRGVASPRQIRPSARSVTEQTRQLVVVRAAGDTMDRSVSVQPVRPKLIEDDWNGEFEVMPFTVPIDMAVYPYQTAADYRAFVWSKARGPLTEETSILMAVKTGGVWYLPQYLRHRLAPPNTDVPITDCALRVLE